MNQSDCPALPDASTIAPTAGKKLPETIRDFASTVSGELAQARSLGRPGNAIPIILVTGIASLALVTGDRMAVALLAAMAIAGWLRQAIVRPGRGAASVDQLFRRTQAAEAATRAKSQYLANASHEIRSPLNAIYGYAQLIERSENEDVRTSARVIRRSAEHLTSLVEGLLDISQLESGLIRIKSEEVNLRDFVEQLFWMMRPEAVAKGLELKLELPAFLPGMVRMDPGRLRQVVINLISNAVKFTTGGTVLLRVRYWNQIAMFEVIDSGPGISPDDQDRIFVPFERGSCDSVQRKSGAGLGLSISRAIVDMLGGQLELESEPGKGSCFRVTLMLGQVADSSWSASTPEATPPQVTGYDGRRRSVLVVDDDASQRSFLRALLESLRFDVTSVPDGETAVSLARQMTFDLAILDITLPGMSGWQVAGHLRNFQPEALRIMMLSADVREYKRPPTATPDHDSFLIKPVEFNALLKALADLLDLTWRNGTTAADAEAAIAFDSFGAEAEPHFVRIREYLAIGHYRGVERCLNNLAEQLPHAKPFVDHMLEMLDQFDLVGMSRKLEIC